MTEEQRTKFLDMAATAETPVEIIGWSVALAMVDDDDFVRWFGQMVNEAVIAQGTAMGLPPFPGTLQ